MSYAVKSSERLRKPSADMETKALLYLMNFRNDSNEIYYFVVDFFNDLTGMDSAASKMWDIQSKGAKGSSPKTIGKELVTLYKNFLSDFTFNHYMLFMGGVSNSFRKDQSKNTFFIENIKDEAYLKMIEGLKEECFDKEYIDNKDISDEKIKKFLTEVFFVIDDKHSTEYVKEIIKEHPRIIPDNDVLTAIFNEIRNVQSSKKNGHVVEGIILSTTDEALNYYRHLTTNEIRLLTLNRILNRNPIESGVPIPFMTILDQCPPESRKDMIESCKISLIKALFNKNLAQSFWGLFEEIYFFIMKNPNDSIQEIFNKVSRENIKKCPDFDVLSVKYFIAVIKDGVKN